jgi:hypothetical protein
VWFHELDELIVGDFFSLREAIHAATDLDIHEATVNQGCELVYSSMMAVDSTM